MHCINKEYSIVLLVHSEKKQETIRPTLKACLLEFFVSRLSEEYLNEMLLDGTYGDQITLQAISDLLGIKLTINLGVEGSVVIFTTSAITSSHITLAISLKEWGFTTLLWNLSLVSFDFFNVEVPYFQCTTFIYSCCQIVYYRRDFILFNLFNFLLVIKIHIFCNSSCSSKTTEMTRVFKKKFKTGIYASFCGRVFFHTPVEFEKIPDSYSYYLDKAYSSTTKMFE